MVERRGYGDQETPGGLDLWAMPVRDEAPIDDRTAGHRT
jgi:hypothetical protein